MADISKIKKEPFCPYFNCYCEEIDSNECKECSFYKEIVEEHKTPNVGRGLRCKIVTIEDEEAHVFLTSDV